MISVLQRAEAALVWLLYHSLRLLPLDVASALGGALGRMIGPWLPANRRARRNLEMALPERRAEHGRIIREMWTNLGRIIGEYPHTMRFALEPERLELVGAEEVTRRRQADQPMLFFTAHFGNWELTYPLMALLDVPGAGVFRAPNNPHLAWLYDHRKFAYPRIDMIPKSSYGARKTIEILKAGKSIAMLVDQKMNDGIEVPFFGIPAMTAPALASFALKFGYPVIPVRIMRVKGAHFRVQFEEPLQFPRSGNRTADLFAAMTQVNGVLERWIGEYPAQWLWLHRRWAKTLYR